MRERLGRVESGEESQDRRSLVAGDLWISARPGGRIGENRRRQSWTERESEQRERKEQGGTCRRRVIVILRWFYKVSLEVMLIFPCFLKAFRDSVGLTVVDSQQKLAAI